MPPSVPQSIPGSAVHSRKPTVQLDAAGVQLGFDPAALDTIPSLTVSGGEAGESAPSRLVDLPLLLPQPLIFFFGMPCRTRQC